MHLFLLVLLAHVGIHAVPIDFSNTVKYPIHVACECSNYQVYVDGSQIQSVSKIETYLADEWNATQVFIPTIANETPKIIGFHAAGGEFSGFLNGFIMDMNNGASYTKYQEWKCASDVPGNDWYAYDYDDSLWKPAVSYGMNYQNNSYQIFEHERMGIHLDAEWLWVEPNSKPNVFCRKKNNHVIPIPTNPATTATTHIPPTTSAPSVLTTIHPTTTSVKKVELTTATIPTTHIPPTTSAPSVLTTIHPKQTSVKKVEIPTATIPTTHIPPTTSAPNVLTTIHPKQTSVKKVEIPTATIPTTHIPPTTSAPSVLTTIHPKQTSVKKVEIPTATIPTSHIPPTTSAPSVLTTIHPKRTSVKKVELTTATIPTTIHQAEPKVTATTIHQAEPIAATVAVVEPKVTATVVLVPQNVVYKIKVIIRYARYSKNQIDKHILHMLHHLDAYSGRNSHLHQLVRQTHARMRAHYNTIMNYYNNLMKRYRNRDRPKNDVNPEDASARFKRVSVIFESMIKLNKYIRAVERKIHVIRGPTKYKLLHIFYVLRKQYQADMVKVMHVYNQFDLLTDS